MRTEVPHPCKVGPCQNEATCTELGGEEFKCTCKAGFAGKLCESKYSEILPSLPQQLDKINSGDELTFTVTKQGPYSEKVRTNENVHKFDLRILSRVSPYSRKETFVNNIVRNFMQAPDLT